MKYKNIINLKWANIDHTAIDCEVDFEDLSDDFVPFTAVASGDYDHSHEIFNECVSGKYGPIAEYVASPEPEIVELPKPTKEELLNKLLEIQKQITELTA